ncbi:serine hydrolase domain-containing protein [Streptomyces cavernicola]|uniref:Serine hydrolase domain-containing protein n=1 Tax=Streptomyces cavernicola TaxID=3043613 RepID=A0ABT6SIX9_9ACTN|nr:serine hydrolase domain-containing protein [Streptomyces sp. B-S-A6]MDI3408140.1 serine hydrolase domain-containing protein [Streptomyces sp. B-S-A6]
MKILTGRSRVCPRSHTRTCVRSRSRRGLAVLAAALGLTASTLLGAAPAPAAERAPSPSLSPAALSPAAVDRFVRAYVEETGLPGAVVAVTRDDKVVHTAGYGHTASGGAMTARTRLPVASLSKAMTAFAVLRLVEAGKVDLDRPVRRYLPEFTMADPRAERITVRQLLTQTSGMADSAYPDLTRAQPHTLKEAVEAMRGAPLATAPGARFRYHNPNYFVAARLVEVVTGRPFAAHMAAEVFRPLGMTRTASVSGTDRMPGRARGYVRAYGTTLAADHPRWFAAGGHGVVTTADDLARWLILQNNDGVSADGRRVAAARTIDVSHTPPATPRGGDYAMGWSRQTVDGGPRQLTHTGQLLTHNSMATLLPDSRTGIAVVTNTGMISGDDAAQITEGLVDLALGERPEPDAPFSVTADPVLAALTLLALALGIRGTLRAGRWVRRTAGRAWWRRALRLLPYALPLLLLAQLAPLFGLLMRRSGTLSQVAHAWPALFVCAAAAALASGAVVTARLVAALRIRTSAPNSLSTDWC